MSKIKYLLPAILVVAALSGCSTDQTDKLVPPTEKVALSNHEFLDKCTTDMATQFHIHSHLTILNQGVPVKVPAEIGITDKCMSSIHTHDQSGIIHVEAPEKRDFLLSDLFYNWKQPYSKDQILDMKIDMTHTLKFYVDGQEVTDLDKIALVDGEDIVIDYYDNQKGPDQLPAAFVWPAGYDND